MADLIREAPLGQIIRYLSRNKYFLYQDEKPDFECPSSYAHPETVKETVASFNGLEARENSEETSEEKVERDGEELGPTLTRTSTAAHRIMSFTAEQLEAQQELSLERTKSLVIVPMKTIDGIVLVDWYTTDDPDNPQNWSPWKKHFVASLICLYTFVVYCGSAIYTPSTQFVAEQFGVSIIAASLGLSMYVLAYGIGPLIFAPLSEIPALGRNVPYIVTFALFVILTVPTALVDNFAGLLVLRFLLGFFGSPCLANGGASMQDIYSLLKLPYALIFWVSAAYCGPALGPLLSGFSVPAENWRWSLWEILWMAGPVFLLFFICLPETSASNILLRRARRLRKLTGNQNLKSQSEIDQANMKLSTIAYDALIKPWQISILDPAVGFTHIYTSIVYGIYYSFFEVFPLVYINIYGMNLGEMGLVFLVVLIACIIAAMAYAAYLWLYLEPDIMKRGLRAQEHRLVPALFAVFGPTIGLFLFGWTARQSIHWVVPTIGILIYAGSAFIILQCIFVYLPLTYPTYAASLFAANDFCRSAFASGSIIFARPMYLNLGIGKGISLLGGLSVLGIIGIYILYLQGANLRARSKFALS
ncbi:major facilitator superfamily domain-containing protein [Lipomyces kononenkoae]|uniref:Major facilitator superfamily domain-containing protein n=1 Tax=Lipomyces kononenkoae TaxID=34357 RepID=A0ACC3SWR6_LIPKO